MNGTIFTVVGLVIGVMLLAAGLYYLAKEKDNAESRKIYGTASLIGLAITAAVFIKIMAAGL